MAKLRNTILIVDDDTDILKAARLFLKQHIENVHTESSPDMIPALMKQTDYDLILLDMNFTRDTTSGKEGLYWLSRIMELDSDMTVILITAFGDVDLAVEGIKGGAADFVLKPWHNEKLLATVVSALELGNSKAEAKNLRHTAVLLSEDRHHAFSEFIGQSSEMKKVFETIERVAATDANVLISGENGTGKELAARAIHRMSDRKGQVFMPVDMGAIHENLFESELFGHVKGAFTDAKESRPGRFELATGGSLFMDEIGNVPLTLQPKLLRVLQSREVTRVGGAAAIPFDIRLICATNMDLTDSEFFRQDLLYRLNTVEINLPPLRDRVSDIPLLADYFLNIMASKYKKEVHGLEQLTYEKLMQYQWPGNVRELQHALERAVILSDGPVLKPSDFPLEDKGSVSHEFELNSFNLDDVEKTVILRVMKKHRGNVTKAATELGLTRTSLYRRMEKYGI